MTEPSPGTSRSRWGRRVVMIYLAACALALVAMLVETVRGHAGTGTMFAAFLGVPWSMLVAGLAPPLPSDWPLAAGLAVRMIPLALFMLLNAAIVRGIAARSERDLSRTATRLGLLCIASALLGSGCSLASRQAVFVAAPLQTLQIFNGGLEETVCAFDLTTSPQWVDQHGDIARVTDLAITGDFQDKSGLPIDVRIAVAPDPPPAPTGGVETWGPVRVDPGSTRRVEWLDGQRLMFSDVSILEHEIRGDGRFVVYTVTRRSDGPDGSSEAHNLRVAAVFELK